MIELDPVNTSSLPDGTMLSFVSREHRRITGGGKGFSSWFQCTGRLPQKRSTLQTRLLQQASATQCLASTAHTVSCRTHFQQHMVSAPSNCSSFQASVVHGTSLQAAPLVHPPLSPPPTQPEQPCSEVPLAWYLSVNGLLAVFQRSASQFLGVLVYRHSKLLCHSIKYDFTPSSEVWISALKGVIYQTYFFFWYSVSALGINACSLNLLFLYFLEFFLLLSHQSSPTPTQFYLLL